jgi:autotransporter-associated beta strand protein
MFDIRYYYAATRGIGGRRLRAALLASSALASAWTLPATPSRAQDATWLTNPGSGDFFDANNWSPGSVPTGTATFGASATTTLTLGAVGSIGGLTLNAGASAYTFDVTANQTFTGAGIVINGGSATINFNAGTNNFFEGSSTAGSAAITSGGTIQTTNTGSLGNATITNNGYLYLQDSGTAGSATITNNQLVYFYYSSTAGTGTIVNNNSLNFSQDSNAGSAHITNAAAAEFNIAHNSTLANATVINSGQMAFWGGGPGNLPSAGNATITNNAGGTIEFSNASTAGSATITNNWGLQFLSASTAGSATITNNRGIGFYDTSTAGNAAITINGTLSFNNASSAGSATITNSGSLGFSHTSTAGNANITNNNNLVFHYTSTADNANITNNSLLSFYDTSTAGNAAITNNDFLQFRDTSTAGIAALVNNAGGTVDFSNSTGPNGDGRLSAGSIAGAGSYLLGANELTVGSNNLSTEVSGVISGAGGSLVKVGTGILTLSGVNTFTGATTVDGGTLAVNGTILSSSGVTVNAGGTLGGIGTVGNTTIMSGGNLAAGNSIGTLSINGNLTFNAGGIYTVEVSPTAADRTNVTGAATLTGATVQAVALMPARFKAQTYTILNASGGFGGTQFAGLDVIGSFRPGARNPHLTYDANNVYLVLDAGEIILPSGASGNQASVAAGINRAVLGGATPPAAFDVLLNLDGAPLKNALTQISGETAVGAQQSAFNATNMFMAQMTDPFNAGRSDAGGSTPGASSYAADAAGAARRAAIARDAFAAIGPTAPTSFEQRWNVWAAGFGGSQTSYGNTALGSNGATSRLFGTAAGADYRFSAHTLAGFALVGGGTNFSVVNGGTGRSDLFQAGAFVRHHNGPAYLSAALAYGWQDVTTDRTVTIAGIDRLQARFQANTFAGRVEGGYRFATPWMNLTPYAAGQVTSFALPAYAESVLSGASTFALSYGAKTVTASRSELGLRTDRSWTLNNAILTLRGRAAWAHDFNPDRAAAATFQTLPGASFVVNGAARARDAVLATASAEMTWRNGFSLGATLEGEFSNVTRSFAGKGIVRYVW